MNNVLYEPLPEEWNGYKINWWFQVGIQIYLVSEDRELLSFEKSEIIKELLFPEEVPPEDEMQECIAWFLNGWCHDKSVKEKRRRKLFDFHVDQWRIYADFRQIYGINLNEADLHWWEFMGMLWNMPHRQSSFLQVMDIRKKEIKPKMQKAEKDAIRQAQHVYGLKDYDKQEEHSYSEQDIRKIDDVDRILKRMKAARKVKKEAVEIFSKKE